RPTGCPRDRKWHDHLRQREVLAGRSDEAGKDEGTERERKGIRLRRQVVALLEDVRRGGGEHDRHAAFHDIQRVVPDSLWKLREGDRPGAGIVTDAAPEEARVAPHDDAFVALVVARGVKP